MPANMLLSIDGLLHRIGSGLHLGARGMSHMVHHKLIYSDQTLVAVAGKVMMLVGCSTRRGCATRIATVAFGIEINIGVNILIVPLTGLGH